MAVPGSLRQAVTERAENRCEYCRLSQLSQEATFHIDHIIPESAGGSTALENLALACVTCSLKKGAKQRLIDPQTGAEVSVFNPRLNHWNDHFRIAASKILGITPVGRATVSTLHMNRAHAMAIRSEEQLRGRYPVA
jgi:hypothetical protein